MLVAEFEANGREEKSILIPGEYVTDGNLRLQFYFENAILPGELNPANKGRKKFALGFYSIRLSDKSGISGLHPMHHFIAAHTEIIMQCLIFPV